MLLACCSAVVVLPQAFGPSIKTAPLPLTYHAIIYLLFDFYIPWIHSFCKDREIVYESYKLQHKFGNLDKIHLEIWRIFVWQFGEL